MGKTYKDSWHHKETKAEAESRFQRELQDERDAQVQAEAAEWDRLEALDPRQQKKSERDAKKMAKQLAKDEKLQNKRDAIALENNENSDLISRKKGAKSPITKKVTLHEIALNKENSPTRMNKESRVQTVIYDDIQLKSLNQEGASARNVDQALDIL